jgi:hypothetical protein
MQATQEKAEMTTFCTQRRLAAPRRKIQQLGNNSIPLSHLRRLLLPVSSALRNLCRYFEPFTQHLLIATLSLVGPLSLIGGTAAIYASLLQHPGSSLTQLSFIFMMLLATQYALQPRLSRKYISPKVDKQSVALVEEVVKAGMAAAIFVSKPAAEVQSALKGTCRYMTHCISFATT